MLRSHARQLALGLLALAALALPARCCTSFVMNCGDGATIASLNFDFSSDQLPWRTITFFPKGVKWAGIPLQSPSGTLPVYSPKYDVLATMTECGAYAGCANKRCASGGVCQDLLSTDDGMNSAGLAVGVLWQGDVYLARKYSAAAGAPQRAISWADLGRYALGQFATVAQLRAFLDPAQLQITTDIQQEGLWTGSFAHFNYTDLPKPSPASFNAPGGPAALNIFLHMHFVDASGDGLLLEGTPDGRHAIYDTKVCTNEPAFPKLQQWKAAWYAKSTAAAKDWPGVFGSGYPAAPPTGPPYNVPLVQPWLIPYASGLDLGGRGYLSSMSRWLRTALNLERCSSYPWPADQWWSPGYTDRPWIQPTGAFKALKRAENFQAAVVVQMSQLSGSFDAAYGMPYSTYATQVMMLRDLTNKVFYYRTPWQNTWSSISLASLAGTTTRKVFPCAICAGSQPYPFSFDITGKGISPSSRSSLYRTKARRPRPRHRHG